MIRFCLFLLFFNFFIFTQKERGNSLIKDQIELVVGENIVLKSDIDFELNFYKSQATLSADEEALLRKDLIEERIKNLILVECAKKDTNIVVDFLMVEEALEKQIEQSILQAGSKETLINELGMSIQEIKNKYRSDMTKKILIEQYSLYLLANINVTRKEVESFYYENLDFFKPISPSFDFSIIEIPATMKSTQKKITFDLLNAIKDSINSKEDFVYFAKKYSEDPSSSKNGGFLGYTNKGTFVKEFEEIAYTLEIGEVGGPVETVFGIHLIYLEDRVGEKIKTFHLLKKTSPEDEDFKITSNKIDSLSEVTKNDPGLFDSFALEYKNLYGLSSGIYYDVLLENIPKIFLSTIQGSKKGDVLKQKTTKGFCLILINNKKKSYIPDLTNSWSEISNMALGNKKQVFLNNWISKKRKYINIQSFNNNY